MTVVPRRLRWTHRMTIHRHTNTLFSGAVASTMPVTADPPEDATFKLCCVASGNCRIKINGTLAGATVTERLSFDDHDSTPRYTRNFFDDITSITSDKFTAGVTLAVTSVDGAYQAVMWFETLGPYGCTFSTLGGLETQYFAKSIGLLDTIVRYVRVEYAAPVALSMEFTIAPGYDGKIFVPTSDFNRVCLPGIYVPQEYEFNAAEKV
jgi:hypothetical protein